MIWSCLLISSEIKRLRIFLHHSQLQSRLTSDLWLWNTSWHPIYSPISTFVGNFRYQRMRGHTKSVLCNLGQSLILFQHLTQGTTTMSICWTLHRNIRTIRIKQHFNLGTKPKLIQQHEVLLFTHVSAKRTIFITQASVNLVLVLVEVCQNSVISSWSYLLCCRSFMRFDVIKLWNWRMEDFVQFSASIYQQLFLARNSHTLYA